MTASTDHRATSSRFRAPHLVHVPPLVLFVAYAALWSLDLLTCTIDARFIQVPVQIALNASTTGSLLIAYFLAVAAAILMVHAGYQSTDPDHDRRLLRLGNPILWWAGLGAGLALIRLIAAFATVHVTANSGSLGGGQQVSVLGSAVVAIVLIVVYAATGAISFGAGRTLTNWVLLSHALVRIRIRLHDLRHARLVGAVARANEHVEIAIGDFDAVAELLESRRVEIAAFGDALFAEARLLIAKRVGDAATTGIATIPPAAEPRRTVTGAPIRSEAGR